MKRTIVPPLDAPPLSPALGGVVHALHGQTMGTTWSVKLVADAARNIAPIHAAIQHELDAVVAQMSTWEPTSDLSRFNEATADSCHTLPAEFSAVLQYALHVARESDGAYDPTAGALVNAWGFGPTQRYGDAGFVAPTTEQLQIAQARGGWQRLEFDGATQRARQPGGMYVDLSAIAKGFGVDQVARRLTQSGFDSFLVEVGGELRGTGTRPDAQPWWVELEQPLSDATTSATTQQMETVIALYDWAIATSGDYRRYFETDAVRYSHTIDPRTGQPIRNQLASVTVLHPECMAADAWSTALGVMGEDDGLALANRLGLCALFIKRNGAQFVEYVSTPLQALME
jgi:thiamine biosynthesis lipoprotein